MEYLADWRWFLRRLAYLVIATVLFACVLSDVVGADTESSWATPEKMAIKQVSPVTTAQHEPVLLSNMDCDLMDYRTPSSSNMQTGCFTATAFGLMDSDSGVVIFNGTDEGLPILPSVPHQVLAPWPSALNLVALDPVNTGGSTISLYTNPLNGLEDRRNVLGQLTAKVLSYGPNLRLKAQGDQPMVINPQTLAFSPGGSWLVAETLAGSFVRINLATLDMTAFAPAFAAEGMPGLFKSQVAISDNGRFVAINNDAAGTLKVYDLTTCSGSVCASFDYLPFVRSQISSLQTVRHIRFVNNGLLSFEANGTAYALAPKEKISSLIDYLALGDSYTSGEGAFDYRAGTDTADNKCHLSMRSYPMLITNDLFSNLGGHSVACSGAVINDINSASQDYKGQVRNVASFKQLQVEQPDLLNSVMSNYLPGYVAQQRFVSQYQPAIISVSVGGNDVGFGEILERCVLPHVSRHHSDNDCFNTYEDRVEVLDLVDRTVSRWVSLHQHLKRIAPETRIYAIGYPDIIDDKGKCGLNVNLGKSELEFSKELVAYLNNSMSRAAYKAGVSFVDISRSLQGHRLCETDSYNLAVNGLTAGKDVGPFGKESYHPNFFGQQLIEQAILRQTQNLTVQLPQSPAEASKQKLLNVPKAGRPIVSRIPATVTNKTVGKGQSLGIKVDGKTANLKPNSAFQVRVDGPVGRVIGTVNSDQGGEIDSSVVVPSDINTGGHTIDITGNGQTDQPIDITQPIYIPNNDNDGDDDGVNNAQDSCPYAENSGQDTDHDGIDDTCDGLMSTRPVDSKTTLELINAGGIISGGASPSSSKPTNHAMDPTKPSSAGKHMSPKVSAKVRTPERSFQFELRRWLPWLAIAIVGWLCFVLGAYSMQLAVESEKASF